MYRTFSRERSVHEISDFFPVRLHSYPVVSGTPLQFAAVTRYVHITTLHRGGKFRKYCYFSPLPKSQAPAALSRSFISSRKIVTHVIRSLTDTTWAAAVPALGSAGFRASVIPGSRT